MDVPVTELRAHLRDWLAVVRGGDEVVVTERGVPVARITAVDAAPVIDRLTAAGVIAPPAVPGRPPAGGPGRPRPRRPLSEHVSDQRR